MKILIVTDRLDDGGNPNLSLVENVIDIWAQEHQVHLLGHVFDSQTTSEFAFKYRLDEKVRKLYFSLKKLSYPEKILEMLSHPFLSMFGFLKYLHIDLIAYQYRKNIKKLDRKYQYDYLIALTAPYYTAKGLAKYKGATKAKGIWMMDPYSTHYLFGGPCTRLQEKHCIKKVAKVFVPFSIEKEYRDTLFLANKDKIQGIGFPALIETKENKGTDLSKEKINLVYSGSLYGGIRKPDGLFKLMGLLKNTKFHLTLLGCNIEDITEDVYKDYISVKDRITFIGKVSKELAEEYILSADILINLGNSVPNMLPSKLVQYFGTGKPIINIKSIQNCCTIPYMNRYPLGITLDTQDMENEAYLQNTEKTLLDLLGKRLSFSEVNRLFPEFTPEIVAEQLLNCLQKR